MRCDQHQSPWSRLKPHRSAKERPVAEGPLTPGQIVDICLRPSDWGFLSGAEPIEIHRAIGNPALFFCFLPGIILVRSNTGFASSGHGVWAQRWSSHWIGYHLQGESEHLPCKSGVEAGRGSRHCDAATCGLLQAISAWTKPICSKKKTIFEASTPLQLSDAGLPAGEDAGPALGPGLHRRAGNAAGSMSAHRLPRNRHVGTLPGFFLNAPDLHWWIQYNLI